MASVAWTERALQDLDVICVFIARDAPRMAMLFADRVFKATDRLGDFPRSGRVVPEAAQEGIREIILESYRIIYRVRAGEVEVLTVLHGARLLKAENLPH